jgi:hypothetical protein
MRGWWAEALYVEKHHEYSTEGIRHPFSITHFRERDEYFPAPDRWTLGHDGRVYVAGSRDEYAIDVYLPDGQLERVIHREFSAPERTPERMRLLRDTWNLAVEAQACSTYELCSTDPAVTRLWMERDSLLCVQHARSIDLQTEHASITYDVFDCQGHLEKQVRVICDGLKEDYALIFLDDSLALCIGSALEPMVDIPRGTRRKPFYVESQTSQVVCLRIAD